MAMTKSRNFAVQIERAAKELWYFSSLGRCAASLLKKHPYRVDQLFSVDRLCKSTISAQFLGEIDLGLRA